jgi:hypothetical protein
MDRRHRDVLARLLERNEKWHRDIEESLDDLRDQVQSQNEGIMRIIDRLGPADPPDASP